MPLIDVDERLVLTLTASDCRAASHEIDADDSSGLLADSAEAGFAVIVALGVLDVVDPSAGPAASQQRQFLRTAADNLGGSGSVLIGVRNRLSFLHFIGHRDSHGFRFEQFLPRSIADRVHDRMGRQEPRIRPLSRQGYRRLLVDAGYADIRFWYVYLDCNAPLFISSTDRHQTISQYVRSVRFGGSKRARAGLRVVRIVDRLRLAGRFAPAFLISARGPSR